MIKILFICHGNICRSVMAEFIMRDMLNKIGLSDRIEVSSAATSTEEIGNDIYPPAKRKLLSEGIPLERHYARQVKRSDYDQYDYLICMEQYNLRNLMRIIPDDPENKISLLLDFTPTPGDISDPWYTGNFDRAYNDINEGCQGLIAHIQTGL